MKTLSVGALAVKLTLAVTVALTVSRSELYSQDYIMPVGIEGKPLLSANMGEIRSTTLHAGLDIKTNGVEGKKIYAAMDGYIARIGIKPYGYGKVLYVAHPNGTTTVYAHLSKFSPEVDEYVRKQRYANKQNTIDLYFTSATFPVKQGEIIGYSGNTGRSYGPHLHYELRETDTQRLLNPLVKGIVNVDDTTPPQIIKLHYMEIDTIGIVPVHMLKRTVTPVNNGKGNYTLSEPIKISGKGYFAVEVTDRKDNSHNPVGTYRLTEKVDGRTIFEVAMDGFTFDQATYIPSMVVYSLNKQTKNDVWRLAKMSDAALPFYRRIVDRGVINPAEISEVVIEAADEAGNVSTLKFKIDYIENSASQKPVIPATAEAVNCKKRYSRSVDGLTVTIPSNALFENAYINMYKTTTAASGAKAISTRPILSDVYVIHDSGTPLHKAMNISISASIPDSLRSRLLLARVGNNGTLVSGGAAKYNNGNVMGSNKTFGTYCVSADTTPPTIKSSFKDGADLSNASSVSFTLSDDFSGVASFSATVDDNWVILEHDTINAKITHYFDDTLSGRNKTHTIVVTAIDGVGNKQTLTSTYKR